MESILDKEYKIVGFNTETGEEVFSGVFTAKGKRRQGLFLEDKAIFKSDAINQMIEELDYKGEISDGSHTFSELYYHRMILFSVICNTHKDKAWKSLLHHDGTMYDDYFIVGINTPKGQYSYHYHVDHWFKFDVEVLKKAPEWDGHQPKDITRLLSL